MTQDRIAEHTPTPWKVDERGGCIAIYEASEDYNCLDIPHKYFIAYFTGYRDDVNQWQVHDKDKANAAFIVEACNNYDRLANLEQINAALLEALERIEKWHGEFPPSGRTLADGTEMSYSAAFGSNGERDYMREIASAAIKLAKGDS